MTAQNRAEQRWLLVVIAVVALLVGAPALYSAVRTAGNVIAPPAPPLNYVELPIPVETPGVELEPLSLNAPLLSFHPGDVVTFLPLRCVTDDAGTGLGRLPFFYTRTLVNSRNGARTDPNLDESSGILQAPVGCHRTRSQINRVPIDTPPGAYYFEGTATATGAQRTATVGWWTTVICVVAPEEPLTPGACE